MPAFFNDPAVHFLLLGALIFVAAGMLDRWRDDRQRMIVVDEGLQSYLVNMYRGQFGTEPDAATLDRLVDNYISDEILYRESLRLGLDSDDEIIRRRLVQKMEFLLGDSGLPREPGQQVLEDWYNRHHGDYVREAEVSFRHLYFTDDTGTRAAAKQRALAAQQSIRSGDFDTAESLSDPFPMQESFEHMDQTQALKVFGQSELARQIYMIPAGEWSGPVLSGLGWHLVRVDERTDARDIPFAEAKEQVRADWQEADKRRRLAESLQELKSHYKVRRERPVSP